MGVYVTSCFMGEPEGDMYADGGEGLDVPAGGLGGGAGGDGGYAHVAEEALVPDGIDGNGDLDVRLIARLIGVREKTVSYREYSVRCSVKKYRDGGEFQIYFTPVSGKEFPPNLPYCVYYTPSRLSPLVSSGGRFCKPNPSSGPNSDQTLIPLTPREIAAVVSFLDGYDAPFVD